MANLDGAADNPTMVLRVPRSTVELTPLVGAGGLRCVARSAAVSTVTVIDTADLRLLSWRVELGRELESGTWTLRLPKWVPGDAGTRAEAAEELPASFGMLVAPFRRGGLLGPTLTVHRRAEVYDLFRGEARRGELLDERLTISGRPRPLPPQRHLTLSGDLDPVTLAALAAAGAAVGARRVTSARSLPRWLGLRTLPHRRRMLAASGTIDDFVRAQTSRRWQAILKADVRIRLGQAADDDGLREELTVLRHEVSGLSPLLRADWTDPLLVGVDEVVSDRSRLVVAAGRYERILDALAEAVAAPPLGGVSGRQTRPVLAQTIEALVQGVLDRGDALSVDVDDTRWATALRSAAQAAVLVEISSRLFGKAARTLSERLAVVVGGLRQCVRPAITVRRDLQGLTAAEIFDAGREYERVLAKVDFGRQSFVEDWPAMAHHLMPDRIRP